MFGHPNGGAITANSGIQSSSRPDCIESVSTTIYIDKFFEVRDHDTPTKYVWNGETRVARVTGDLSTNTRIQRLRLWTGSEFLIPYLER